MQSSVPLQLSSFESIIALITYLGLWFIAVFLAPLIVLVLYYFLGFYGPLLFLIAYLPFWLDSSSKSGKGRPFKWILNSRLIKMWAAYFPMKLVVTHPFPTTRTHSEPKKYVFAMFPHGTIPLHAILGLVSNACDRYTLIPGIDMRVLSVPPNFWLPFWRDLFLAMGSVDSSLHVARKVLNCGKSLLVFPGGVAEMMQAVPGKSYNIVAESRKGFIRLAIESGADVVPVFAFGANEFIHSSQNKTLERINTWFAKKFMFFFPVYFGRWKTLVPFKHPINCIVGKPIPVIKSASPSAEQVETVHRQFLKDLKELFETHKTQYGSEHDTLTIN